MAAAGVVRAFHEPQVVSDTSINIQFSAFKVTKGIKHDNNNISC